VIPVPLVRKVKERLVMAIVVRQEHRATHANTELILIQRRFHRIEIIGSVKDVIPVIFPRGAVQLVGPGFGYDVDSHRVPDRTGLRHCGIAP